MSLTDASVVLGRTEPDDAAEEGTREFTFEVVTPTRAFVMCCERAEQRAAWVAALKSAIAAGAVAVLRSGWVEKRGGGTFSSKWAKRYFVLARNVSSSAETVYYYKVPPDLSALQVT
jgi:hypothetical protein